MMDGIVAGIGVTIGVDFLKRKKQNANDKNNLSFEIKCNLSSAISCTTNKLLQDGRIYTYLSCDSLLYSINTEKRNLLPFKM